MRFLPKSLSGQLVLILLLTLLAAQGISLILFAGERREAIRDIYRQNVVARTVSLVSLLEDTPTELQSRVVAAASSGLLRFELLSSAPSVQAENTGERGQFLKATLAAALDIPKENVVVAKRNPEIWHRRHHRDDDDDDDDDDHHRQKRHHWYAKWVTLSVGLPDGKWLSVTAGPPPGAPRWGKWFLVSLILSGLAIAGVAVLAGRRVAKPMRELADAAGRLGRGEPVGDVAEAGPRETRETIRAFNLMHDRLERYLRDRMAMLAAISHDLKTPITSLRLRAEFIEDEEMRSKILATLDEMQAMTESTLDFIREDAARDPGRVTDVAALAESIVADFADTGRPAVFTGEMGAMVVCRSTSIRRALSNLIENAIAYGESARVSVEKMNTDVRIVVDDDGPGIEQGDLERVFDPFTRLEASRNRATGGVGLGLGLAIARTIARAHGGDVMLENRGGGRLRAVLSLPVEG
jgi:signal transduction histidine kinase